MSKANRTTYYDRKLRSLCVYCGKTPARPGRVACMACALKKSREYYARTERDEKLLDQLRITMKEAHHGKE